MTETPSPEPQPDAGWYHPAGRAYRFTILFFAGFMIYGSYFAYDAIGAIVDALMADLGRSERCTRSTAWGPCSSCSPQVCSSTASARARRA